MELSKQETNIIKGLAALFLVFLHLFDTREYAGKIQSLLILRDVPIEYYLSLATGACVPMYLFCSGYGLTIVNKKNINIKDNAIRVLKLLINYWIVLIAFVIIGHLLGNNNYPGSIKEFLMNFFLLSKSYNGAWWFLQTYVILVFLSPVIIKLVNKNNSLIVFFISGVLYFVAFLQSVRGLIIVGNNEFILIIYNMIINFLNCQFSFIVGVIFIKESIITKIRYKLKEKAYAQLLSYMLIVFTIVMNVIIENWVIGPITAILVITTFSIIRLNEKIKCILHNISIHSTNIWLTHMFFYMIFFEDLIYMPKYSIFIFIWLIAICIATSYIINTIYKPIVKIINNRIESNSKTINMYN